MLPGTCLDCVHATNWAFGSPEPVGECHRFPPQLVPQVQGLTIVGIDSRWPLIKESTRCGEFQEKVPVRDERSDV